MNQNSLSKFITAQERDYATALKEIKQGRKRSHWMWYIFPQIAGLGFSATSQLYAIKDKAEAIEYLKHPILGARLTEISRVLIDLDENNASRIFGHPDDMKLKSSMTLFGALPNADPVFDQVLTKYFNGIKDQLTLRLLAGESNAALI